jgi:hypothetical protein
MLNALAMPSSSFETGTNPNASNKKTTNPNHLLTFPTTLPRYGAK